MRITVSIVLCENTNCLTLHKLVKLFSVLYFQLLPFMANKDVYNMPIIASESEAHRTLIFCTHVCVCV